MDPILAARIADVQDGTGVCVCMLDGKTYSAVALGAPEANDNACTLYVEVTGYPGAPRDRFTFADRDSMEVGWCFPD